MTTPALCYIHRDRAETVRSCSTCQRIAIEQDIVIRTVNRLLGLGYRLNVRNGGTSLELPKATDQAAELLPILMETDDEFLIVCRNNGRSFGWIHFVYGNDGHDVISDYTVNLESDLKPINDYADSLC